MSIVSFMPGAKRQPTPKTDFAAVTAISDNDNDTSPVHPPSSAHSPHASIVSLDPTRFLSIFDIPAELRRNRDDYVGQDQIAIFNYPTMVATTIDRIRAECKGVSVSLVFNCALARGIEDISRSPVVNTARLLKHSLNKVVGVDVHELELVLNWLRAFTPPPIGISTSTRRVNVRLPESLKDAVYEVANDLGVSASTLAVISVLHTLSMQSYLLPAHRDLMSDTVAAFYEAVEMRQYYAKGVVELLKAPH